ncbi:hypothetical protein FRC11_010794 [Ceratobasidium sp. 423]|nr:hypothetical protein FRC11_010794 [Ceratobasidium sp. 423]
MPPPPELNQPANEPSEATQSYAPNGMPLPPMLTEPANELSEVTVLPSKLHAKRKNGVGEGHGIKQGDQGGRKGSCGGGRGRRGGWQSKSKADAEDEDGGAAGETPITGPSKGGRGGRGGWQAKSKAIIKDAKDRDEEPVEDMPIAGPSNQQPGNHKIPRIKCKV